MRAAVVLVVVLGLAACGGGGGGPEREMLLDPDVAPVTEGDWIRLGVDTSWQWQLTGTVNAGYEVDVYDVDLFESPQALIDGLHADGRTVICYFSAGSSEDWREDFSRFEADDLGKKLGGWEGENWLDIRSPNVQQIMLDRLDMAVAKGCDGVEPDNMDAFDNPAGFDLSYRDQQAYNRFIGNAAHERDLAVGLKNDTGQLSDLLEYYDFSVNEECHRFDECAAYGVFVQAGKPVLNAEYTQADTQSAALELAASICPGARAADLRTLILPLDLDDAFRVACDDI